MTSIGTTRSRDSQVFDSHEKRPQTISNSFLIYWSNGGTASNEQQLDADDHVPGLPAGWYWKKHHLAQGEPQGPFMTSGLAHKDACRGLSCPGDTAAA